MKSPRCLHNAPHKFLPHMKTASRRPSTFLGAVESATSAFCNTRVQGLKGKQTDINWCPEPSQLRLRRYLLVFGPSLLLSQASSQTTLAANETPFYLQGGLKSRLTGVPDDLYYPQFFLGKWTVESVLVDVDFPNGPEEVADASVVRRAEKEDKNRIIKYNASFIHDGYGHVVSDRRFNTASLLSLYTPYTLEKMASMIEWDVKNPGRLDVRMPDAFVSSRVTKRLEDVSNFESERLETSEFMEQVFDDGASTKVKAFQTFTKYRWRNLDRQGPNDNPEIVATQVVSEFAPEKLALSKTPSVVWRYKMRFTRNAATL